MPQDLSLSSVGFLGGVGGGASMISMISSSSSSIFTTTAGDGFGGAGAGVGRVGGGCRGLMPPGGRTTPLCIPGPPGLTGLASGRGGRKPGPGIRGRIPGLGGLNRPGGPPGWPPPLPGGRILILKSGRGPRVLGPPRPLGRTSPPGPRVAVTGGGAIPTTGEPVAAAGCVPDIPEATTIF